MIELASEEEHLAGANYIVHISNRKPVAVDTVEEAWKELGSRGVGDIYRVSSPSGHDVSDFIPF
jgi:hypothetical protein